MIELITVNVFMGNARANQRIPTPIAKYVPETPKI
jgi:hypothetical protein